MTVHEKAPVAETVAPHVPIVAPDPTLVVIVFPGVNPVPETEIDTPLGPCDGESEMAGVVTLNEAVAASKLPSEPVAVTV